MRFVWREVWESPLQKELRKINVVFSSCTKPENDKMYSVKCFVHCFSFLTALICMNVNSWRIFGLLDRMVTYFDQNHRRLNPEVAASSFGSGFPFLKRRCQTETKTLSSEGVPDLNWSRHHDGSLNSSSAERKARHQMNIIIIHNHSYPKKRHETKRNKR